MKWFNQVGVLVWKDLRVEFRSREIIYTMAFFAVMVVLMFSFGFLREGKQGQMVEPAEVAPGFLFIAVIFAGTLGLSRAFDREREGDTMRGLLLSPVPRSAIIAGKAVAIAVFILTVELLVVPLIWLFFDAPILAAPLTLAVILILTALGFATVGSVFAGILLRSRSRDVLLPIVLYPLVVPLLIAGVKGVAEIVLAGPDAFFWIKFLVFYDVLFAAVALWTFESLVIE